MDPEQTFLRVHARLSGVLARLLTPRFRTLLEYLCLLNAVLLLGLLVIIHVNFVGQPGCANVFASKIQDAQIVQIKITDSWSRMPEEALAGRIFSFQRPTYMEERPAVGSPGPDQAYPMPDVSGEAWNVRAAKFWLNLIGTRRSHSLKRNSKATKAEGSSQENPSKATKAEERRSRIFEPTYLYSSEKGYLMLSEAAKLRSNVLKVNISISARDRCFGNRWQQLLIDNFVGYDTILMNSLLNAKGNGYLYNFQTKELYNLNYVQDFNGVPHGLDDFIVFKCGVLITSLFVFFTTTMSVSFTLRETQSRMLKFTVQLQHHARHRLPTYRLIFVHVVESLVFVPIMIGILFFLFEFFDDQLLAFMVLTLVWLCELFTMISVRTPLSMQYFPRFFFLYFMVFHIYFFSYTYGFSYLAFSAAGAFMQHLVLYFWNRFEVPALQAYLRRRAMLHQQGVHISSAILTSTLQVASLSRTGNANQHGGFGAHPWTTPTSTNHAAGTSSAPVATQNPAMFVEPNLQAGINVRGHDGNVGDGPSVDTHSRLVNSNVASSDIHLGSDTGVGVNGGGIERVDEGRANVGNFGSAEAGGHLSHGTDTTTPVAAPTPFASFGSVLPWILGSQPGGLVSLLAIFRDTGEQIYNSATQQDELAQLSWQRANSSEEGLRHRHVPQSDGSVS